MFRIISRGESKSGDVNCSISRSVVSVDNGYSAKGAPPFFVEGPDSKSRFSLERGFNQSAEALGNHPREYREIEQRLEEADGKIQNLEGRLQAARAETKLAQEATQAAAKRVEEALRESKEKDARIAALE